MPRFGINAQGKNSPLVQAALDAMRALYDSNEGTRLDYVFAEVVHRCRERVYLKRQGGKLRHSGHVCTRRLITGGRCPGSHRYGPHDLPASDHLKEWMVNGKTVSIVSEPYQLSLNNMREIVSYAEANGLDVFVSADRAAHFPGHTLHIEWTRKSDKGRDTWPHGKHLEQAEAGKE